MSLARWKSEDLRTLQVICHYQGCESFLKAIVEVLYRASDDMEELSSEIAENYRDKAQQLAALLEDSESA